MKVPGGMSPLVAFIGTAQPANIDGQKVKSRPFKSPLLVRFLYPFGWLVDLPNITDNGEAGNIGANNYVKGDSANFASLELPKGEQLSTLKKEFFKGWLSSQSAPRHALATLVQATFSLSSAHTAHTARTSQPIAPS